jgi:hypothetical protein
MQFIRFSLSFFLTVVAMDRLFLKTLQKWVMFSGCDESGNDTIQLEIIVSKEKLDRC